MKSPIPLLLLGFVTLVFPRPRSDAAEAAVAASGTGTLTGWVSNAATGDLLRGATIVLPQLGRSALSDDTGVFVFSNLPAGEHEVIASYVTTARSPFVVTASQGKDAANMTLSQKRSEAVRAYLIKQGVEPERLEARGFGETVPVADNKTANGRAENRRVEFRIMERIER
jgi:hypothetical protein